MSNPNLSYWLAAMYLPTIGPRTIFKWIKLFENKIQNLFNASPDELQSIGIKPNYIFHLKNPKWANIEKDFKWAEKENHHLICFDDEDYPSLLKEIADPPLVLFIKGNKSILSCKQLAIVGSRNATHQGLKLAESFAYYLAENGFVITSGLALGVDGASHKAALAAKGFTIGVLGTGLNCCYPSSHQSLMEEMIKQNGAVISEFPLETPPKATNFPRRNRIIGGLALGVLVVEAALKSGSLITARHALEQGREVFAIPGSIHNPLARGCHYLIRQGAKLVETGGDILEELGSLEKMVSQMPSTQSSQFIENKNDLFDTLSSDEISLYQQILYEITPLEVIILRSGLTAGEVSSMLLTLELLELIQSVPGGYVRISTNH